MNPRYSFEQEMFQKHYERVIECRKMKESENDYLTEDLNIQFSRPEGANVYPEVQLFYGINQPLPQPPVRQMRKSYAVNPNHQRNFIVNQQMNHPRLHVHERFCPNHHTRERQQNNQVGNNYINRTNRKTPPIPLPPSVMARLDKNFNLAEVKKLSRTDSQDRAYLEVKNQNMERKKYSKLSRKKKLSKFKKILILTRDPVNEKVLLNLAKPPFKNIFGDQILVIGLINCIIQMFGKDEVIPLEIIRKKMYVLRLKPIYFSDSVFRKKFIVTDSHILRIYSSDSNKKKKKMEESDLKVVADIIRHHALTYRGFRSRLSMITLKEIVNKVADFDANIDISAFIQRYGAIYFLKVQGSYVVLG